MKAKAIDMTNNLHNFIGWLAKGTPIQYPVEIAEVANAETLCERAGRAFRLYRPEGSNFVWFIVEAKAA